VLGEWTGVGCAVQRIGLGQCLGLAYSSESLSVGQNGALGMGGVAGMRRGSTKRHTTIHVHVPLGAASSSLCVCRTARLHEFTCCVETVPFG
jgi:hypothetical protein